MPETGEPFPQRYAGPEDLGNSYTPGLGNYSKLEPLPQVQVRPDPNETSWPQYGAVEVRLNIQFVSQTGGPVLHNFFVVVVTEDLNDTYGAYVQSYWSRNGDNLTVNFVGPNGMFHQQTRFAVLARTGQITGTPTLTSVTYYDLDGNEVAGPVPTVVNLL